MKIIQSNIIRFSTTFQLLAKFYLQTYLYYRSVDYISYITEKRLVQSNINSSRAGRRSTKQTQLPIKKKRSRCKGSTNRQLWRRQPPFNAMFTNHGIPMMFRAVNEYSYVHLNLATYRPVVKYTPDIGKFTTGSTRCKVQEGVTHVGSPSAIAKNDVVVKSMPMFFHSRKAQNQT